MSNKRARKKLNRAAPQYPPGGGLMYVPVGQQQGVLGQTFYGNTMKNIPVGQSSLFSPGIPLPAQTNVDPSGKPVQFRFPVSYNTFPVDRTLGYPDIPGFEQLRMLAKMYDGCTLNERYWLDLVPRMTLDIRLKKIYVDQGAEPKDYQKEITYFKNFWEKPDGRQDTHTWLRKALREQSQIDELYLYKNRTRGRKLLGLWVVAGDQMKPLLDDWGMEPEAPGYAYQQYPWGIPGMMYSTDQMIHYQESPAANTPYGFSRVERVIMRVNQALRKEKKDLTNFTEGNIPQSFMEVPETPLWTPDQIDSYEQSWNALLAGQVQQQVRVKFLQPGMKYVPAEQYQMMSDFDLFLFRVTCGCYGVPPTEFGFTDDANRATGESQEDLVYRRTIGPNAKTYARIMTQCMAEDFPPEYHGEMFEAHFAGFEEVEDEQKKASANTTYTGAGVLGLTNAAKLGNLPIDPEAPVIGRVLSTPNGTIFLDDKEFMDAWRTAQMAGFKMAANPPQPPRGGAPTSGNGGQSSAQQQDEEEGDNEVDEGATLSRIAEVMDLVEESMRLLRARNVTKPEMVSQQGTCTCAICTSNHGRTGESEPPYHDGCDCTMVPKGEESEQRAFTDTESEASRGEDTGRELVTVARGAAQPEYSAHAGGGQDRAQSVSAEYRRWRTRAIEDVKAGRTQRAFVSEVIPAETHAFISSWLLTCHSDEEVRRVFNEAREREASFFVAAASNSGGNPPSSRSNWKLRW